MSGGHMETSHLHWLGHSSFRIEDGKVQIYIDPYQTPSHTPKADIILITHAHYDHFSPEDIAKIQKKETIFVAPKDVSAQLKSSVVAVEPGKSYAVAGLHVQTVPAYNINKKYHPKENGWVGYVITLSNGEKNLSLRRYRFYSGDENDRCGCCHDAVRGTYTMTAKEMAEAANSFKPKILIPMHWGDIVGSRVMRKPLRNCSKGRRS